MNAGILSCRGASSHTGAAPRPTSFGRRVVWLVLPAIVAAILLGATPAWAAFPGGNGQIVFQSSGSAGNYDIYAMSSDGGGLTRLTTDSGEDYGPVVSPDGTKVAYANYSSGNVIIMNMDGSSKTTLASGYSPAWSPDGANVVFTRSGDLYVIGADGNGQRLLIANGDDAAWSPDGTKIAFIRGRFLMTANPDGNEQASIAEYATSPSWSPDGTKIVYKDWGGSPGLVIVNNDGTGRYQATTNGDDEFPAYSPDGNTLVLGSGGRADNYELFLMPVSGGGASRLTYEFPAYDSQPDWQAIPAGGTLSIADSSVAEGTGGSNAMTFTLALSAPVTENVSVDYATTDGTALAPDDYTATSGTAVIPAGQTTATLEVPLVTDSTYEADEAFALELSGPVGATLSDDQGIGTIHDDDYYAPQASFVIDPMSPRTGDEVVFTARVDAAATVVGYTWDFGDGSLGTGPSARHAYASAGTYTVVLTVIDEVGNTDSAAQDVVVTALPTLSVDDVSVTEGSDPDPPNHATFAIRLSEPSAETVSVDAATADGSALASADYVATEGGLVFAPGEIEKTVEVEIVPDTADEADEHFYLELSAPDGATIARGSGMGTILDDDSSGVPGSPGVSVADVSVTEGTGGTTVLVFRVTLPLPQQTPVTVDYRTVDDSALQPADYEAASGSLSFAAGEIGKTVEVVVVPDALVEEDERFAIILDNPSGAPLGDAAAWGTIIDDDLLQVSFTASPSSPKVFEPVAFVASVDSAAPVSEYRWDFGDGAFATGAAPTHRYSSPGTFQVSLVVEDAQGSTASAMQSVEVGVPAGRTLSGQVSVPTVFAPGQGALEDRAPLAGARLTVEYPAGRPGGVAVTDANGRFAVAGLLATLLPDGPLNVSLDVRSEQGARTAARLTLGPVPSVRTVELLARKLPSESFFLGGHISLATAEGGQAPAVEVFVYDNTGRAVARSGAGTPGDWRVSVNGADLSRGARSLRLVLRQQGVDVDMATVTLDPSLLELRAPDVRALAGVSLPAGRTLGGRVTVPTMFPPGQGSLEDRAPLAGARVTVSIRGGADRSALTDSEGRFLLTGLFPTTTPNGSIGVDLQIRSQQDARTVATPITLGSVPSVRTADLLARAVPTQSFFLGGRVSLAYPASGDLPAVEVLVYNDAGEIVARSGVGEPGDWRLSVNRADIGRGRGNLRLALRQDGVEVDTTSFSPNANSLEVRAPELYALPGASLPAGRTLGGRVTVPTMFPPGQGSLEDRAPLAGALVTVSTRSGDRSALTDSEGRFLLTGLFPNTTSNIAFSARLDIRSPQGVNSTSTVALGPIPSVRTVNLLARELPSQGTFLGGHIGLATPAGSEPGELEVFVYEDASKSLIRSGVGTPGDWRVSISPTVSGRGNRTLRLVLRQNGVAVDTATVVVDSALLEVRAPELVAY